MVGVLVDQIDGMEDTWDNIIKIVHQYSIDTHKNSLMMEWSRMVTSTRKIVDRVLEVSDQFHVALPDLGDPDLNKSELYFFAGEHEDIGALNDNLVAEIGKSNIDGACQGEGVAADDVTNDEFQVDSNEVCQEMREVVQPWTGLKPPEKPPEPVAVPEGSAKSQRLVLDMSRRSTYVEINPIVTFLDYHDRERGGYPRGAKGAYLYGTGLSQAMEVRGEDPNDLIGSNNHNLVSALGMVIGDTLRSSERFTREAIKGKQTPVVPQTEPANVTDKDAARLESAYVRAWILENTRELVKEVKRHPQGDGAVPKPVVHKEEVDIKTVTVASSKNKGNLQEAQYKVRQQAGPHLEVMNMEDTPPNNTPLARTTGKHDRLDNTLCPAERLSRTMSLKEATKWLKNFESYMNWNGLVIAKNTLTNFWLKCVIIITSKSEFL